MFKMERFFPDCEALENLLDPEKMEGMQMVINLEVKCLLRVRVALSDFSTLEYTDIFSILSDTYNLHEVDEEDPAEKLKALLSVKKIIWTLLMNAVHHNMIFMRDKNPRGGAIKIRKNLKRIPPKNKKTDENQYVWFGHEKNGNFQWKNLSGTELDKGDCNQMFNAIKVFLKRLEAEIERLEGVMDQVATIRM